MDIYYFHKSWLIKDTDKSSTVYRYLEQEYIDLFFKDGTLKLSSFESNRKMEGNVRQDTDEGVHHYRIVNRNRTDKIDFEIRDFDARRLLCCSTKLDLDFFLPHFNVDGCFEISNSIGFGYEIAKTLSGYVSGQEGKVNYNDNKLSHLLLEQHLDLPDINSNMSNQELYPHIDRIGKVSIGAFFRKPIRYAIENEYRLVWHCDFNHDIIIKCPNALRYCKKIT